MARQLQRWARPLAADRALVHRAARRLGHPASIPRAIMSRSPEALAFGSRRHFIPASLSLPLCGCLLNRSRDCSRSRVPPLFSVGAMLTLLRLPLSPACASLRRDFTTHRLGNEIGSWIRHGLSPPSARPVLDPARLFRRPRARVIHK